MNKRTKAKWRKRISEFDDDRLVDFVVHYRNLADRAQSICGLADREIKARAKAKSETEPRQ